MQSRSIIRAKGVSAFAIASAALFGLCPVSLSAQSNRAPQPFSDSLIATGKQSDPAVALGQDLKIPVSEARDRLALQQATARYAEALLVGNPDGFVDLEIRHEASFKVIVYYAKSVDRNAMTALAPAELRRYLVFRPLSASHNTIKTEQDTITATLRNAGLPFGVEFDLSTDRFRVTIPDLAREQEYRNKLPANLAQRIEIISGGVSQDVAAIYGGWWWHNSGARCTTGWPVRDSSGKEAILTAGHCVPPMSMEFSDWWTGAPALTTVSSFDNRIVAGQSVDYAFFTLGTHTTSRVINVQNESSYVNADGSRNYVPGIVTAYYEIASPVLISNGAYVCKEGSVTLLTCGYIVSTSYSDSNVSNVVKVSKSTQGNIAAGGDSGGPVFGWTNSNSQVVPLGVVKSAYLPGGLPCKNTSTTASSNTTCFYTFLPLRTIRGYSPFTVNTVNGFVAP